MKPTLPTVLCAKGCGRIVSANKLYCMTCIEEIAHATVAAREEEPMEETTHIVMKFASQNREDLYDARNGMLLASRQGEIVRFGSEPKEAGNRLFLSSDYAAKWLREVAGMRMVTQSGRLTLTDVEPGTVAPVIEERDAESTIIMPSGGPVRVLSN